MYHAISFLIILIIIIIWIILYCNPKTKFENKHINDPITNTFYWINLDKAVTRRNNIEKLFNKYNINHVRIPAVQGGPLEKDKAIACTTSHVKAIKTFFDTNDEVGIICEDDITMEYKQYWRNNLSTVIKDAPKDWEIIQLSVTTSSYAQYKLIFSNPKVYIPYHLRVSSTLIYLINRKGASKIVQNIKSPSDWVEDYIYNQCVTYIYKYPMFTYPDDNDSDIHPDHLPEHVYSKMLIRNYLKYD